MTEAQLFDFMQANRQIFATWFLIGTIFPIAVIYSAYMFRNFTTGIRAAAMVSALCGVLLLAFFTTGVQMVFFTNQLTALGALAAQGSEGAANFMNQFGFPIGQEVTMPLWMTLVSTVQVLINRALTVYIFLFAKWEK